jgi:hypothetical protein
MVSSKRWTVALVVTLLGAQGCIGSADTAVETRLAATSERVTLVGGTPSADGLRAYWRFTEGGSACVVRADTAASAQDAPCVVPPGAAPTDLHGLLGGGSTVGAFSTPGTGGARTLRAVAEDSADLSSIGIGTGGR